jgi:hypothetical protein
VILPAYKGHWNVGWTKSGAIVPEKIDGKYWMYFLGTSANKTDEMGLAYSEDLIHWAEATETPVLPRRLGQFDSQVVEPGPAPIVTRDGIVLIYNAADDKLVYRTAIAVFDRKDPRKVLSRSSEPIFAPEKEWEKVGQVANVVFVEGMVRQGSRYFFYYGGADKYVGVAEAQSGSELRRPQKQQEPPRRFSIFCVLMACRALSKDFPMACFKWIALLGLASCTPAWAQSQALLQPRSQPRRRNLSRLRKLNLRNHAGCSSRGNTMTLWLSFSSLPRKTQA